MSCLNHRLDVIPCGFHSNLLYYLTMNRLKKRDDKLRQSLIGSRSTKTLRILINGPPTISTRLTEPPRIVIKARTYDQSHNV
jgi:hypothetical protein